MGVAERIILNISGILRLLPPEREGEREERDLEQKWESGLVKGELLLLLLLKRRFWCELLLYFIIKNYSVYFLIISN